MKGAQSGNKLQKNNILTESPVHWFSSEIKKTKRYENSILVVREKSGLSTLNKLN
jgi:hypothetical protein